MTRYIKKIICGILVMMMAVAMLPVSVLAADPVALAVSSASGAAGGDAVVSLSISADSGLAVGEFTFQYDDTKLTYKSHTVGTAAAGGLSDVNVTPGNGSNSKILFSFIEASGITAAGTMLSITFTVKAGWVGTSPVTLTTRDFCNASWASLQNSVQNGGVTATSQTTVAVTKTTSGMNVNVYGWKPEYKYQVWTYQEIISDFDLGGESNVKTSQWVLSQPYITGQAGTEQPDGSILYTVPTFNSPDSNYRIAVRIAGADNNYISEVRDAYTPDDVSEVVIVKTLVDGIVSSGTQMKEVKAGAQTKITVVCNDVADIICSAFIEETAEALVAIGSNEFSWDIAAMEPGTYNIVVQASNGDTQTSQSLRFELYSNDDSIVYGNINAMEITYENGGLNITPEFANGSFWYRVSEPGRQALHTSGLIYSADTIHHALSKPGIYLVAGFVNREYVTQIGSSFDDGIIRTIKVTRADIAGTSGNPGGPGGQPGGTPTQPVAMTLGADAANPNNVTKGTTVTLAAQAGRSSSTLYSFWRMDAAGIVLVKDWSTSKTLVWAPARIGEYTIIAKAKGADAGSYEEQARLVFNVTYTGESTAQIDALTFNTADLDAAKARVPVMVKLTAAGADAGSVQYKLYVNDEDMGTRALGQYSPSSEFIWTPRKAGTYTLTAMVNGSASYGYADFTAKYTVTVE